MGMNKENYFCIITINQRNETGRNDGLRALVPQGSADRLLRLPKALRSFFSFKYSLASKTERFMLILPRYCMARKQLTGIPQPTSYG
jgi:hypothetical protein